MSMNNHHIEYKSFTKYIIAWLCYVFLSVKWPTVFTSKLYIFVGIVYLAVTHILYAKRTCSYLISLYPNECRQAVKRRYPPDAELNEDCENLLTLVVYNQGYRQNIFCHSDRVLTKIYINNIVKRTFSYFMFFSISLSWFFNYFLV